MGKYTPLTEFLRKQALDEVRMTFAQIERVIDAETSRRRPNVIEHGGAIIRPTT